MSRTQWVGVLGIAGILIWLGLSQTENTEAASPPVATATAAANLPKSVSVDDEAAKELDKVRKVKAELTAEMRELIDKAKTFPKAQNFVGTAEATLTFFEQHFSPTVGVVEVGKLGVAGVEDCTGKFPCNMFIIADNTTGQNDALSWHPNWLGPIGIMSLSPNFAPTDGFMPYAAFRQTSLAMQANTGSTDVLAREAMANRFVSMLAVAATGGEYGQAIDELLAAVENNAVPSVHTRDFIFATPTSRIVNCFGGTEKLTPFAAKGVYVTTVLDLNAAAALKKGRTLGDDEFVEIYRQFLANRNNPDVQKLFEGNI